MTTAAFMGMLRGLLTLALFIAFISLWVWAWSKRRHGDFAEAARLPLQDDDAAKSPTGDFANWSEQR